MENKPTGAGPIEEAVSEISSAFSLFSQLKSAGSDTLALIKKTVLYVSVAWWILAGTAGFIHKRIKAKKH